MLGPLFAQRDEGTTSALGRAPPRCLARSTEIPSLGGTLLALAIAGDVEAIEASSAGAAGRRRRLEAQARSAGAAGMSARMCQKWLVPKWLRKATSETGVDPRNPYNQPAWAKLGYNRIEGY